MTSGRTDSLRLFRVLGVDIYVHWSWIFVAIFQINYRSNAYSSVGWSVAEYLALFLIILTRGLGHVLATRQVGGKANQILLWPLGGIAFASPLPRRGADLWRISAGPLVNVGLLFAFTALVWLDGISLTPKHLTDLDDLDKFLRNLWFINFVVLIFNVLPIYPLDGGQILRTLLSFFLSRFRSLYVATIVGFLGVAAVGLWALHIESLWVGIIAFYLFVNCRRNWEQARTLSALERMPKRKEFVCPSCHAHPPIGALWCCHQCRGSFDTFETPAECPKCHTVSPTTPCHYCRAAHPIAEWMSQSSK